MKSKTTISLTYDEIEIIKTALNDYSLDMMNKSTTWGVDGSYGKEDFYHRKAYNISQLWSRVYKAGQRMLAKETTTAE